MKEKVIISSFTLISSLAGYFYAKSKQQEVMPYVMIGGFAGGLLGEALAQSFCKQENKALIGKKRKQYY